MEKWQFTYHTAKERDLVAHILGKGLFIAVKNFHHTVEWNAEIIEAKRIY